MHSKCLGFALPGEYYAVYRMDKASLESGVYAYGDDIFVGWPHCDGA